MRLSISPCNQNSSLGRRLTSIMLSLLMLIALLPSAQLALAAEVDWESLYESYLSSKLYSVGSGVYRIGSSEDLYFLLLADINMDQVPELILKQGGMRADGGPGTNYVCTIQNGLVFCNTTMDHVGTLSLHRAKSSGSYKFITNCIVGEGAEIVGEYSRYNLIERFNISKETDGKMKTYYYVNGGQSVSKSKYESKYKDYFSNLTKIATYTNYKLGSNPLNAYRQAAAEYRSLISQGKVPPDPSKIVSSISLPKKITTYIGTPYQLEAQISPATAAEGGSWSSSKSSIASVSQSGLVTPRKSGSTTITVQTSGKKASCIITVKPRKVSSIHIIADFSELGIGETATLTAEVSPSNATNQGVSWKSSNTKIAKVNSLGVVTGTKVGKVNITATAKDGSNKKSSITLRIVSTPTQDPNQVTVTNVSIKPSSLSLSIGEATWLTANISPSNATNQTVNWTSSNPSVASVSGTGYVSAKEKGTTTITCKTADGGKIATCAVEVKESSGAKPVTGVSLSPSSIALYVGETKQVIVSVLPSDAKNKAVAWLSGNTQVAMVDSNGFVSAKAVGKATITVLTSDGHFTASCEVEVKPTDKPVTAITLSPSTLSLSVGGTKQLIATIAPSDASNKFVNWGSLNSSIATVDSNGWVTAIKAGTATIQVASWDNKVKATCSVTVTDVQVDGVTVNPQSLNLKVGDTSQLTATVSPSNAADKSVSWSSSNTTVATVSSVGLVTAKANGTATITLTSQSGGKTANCTITVAPKTLSVNITPSKTSVNVGESVSWSIVPSGGSGQYKIDYEVYLGANGMVSSYNAGYQASKTVSYTPQAAGNLALVVFVTDNNGLKGEAESTITKVSSVIDTGISVSPTSFSMTVGTTKQMTATVSPSNATNKTVTWSSDNTAVATVSTGGLVTAKASGSATITAKSASGKPASCLVTVNYTKLSGSIVVSCTSATIGDNVDYDILPTGGSGQYRFSGNIYNGSNVEGEFNNTDYTTNKLLRFAPQNPGSIYMKVTITSSDGQTLTLTSSTTSVNAKKLSATAKARASSYKVGDDVDFDTVVSGGKMPFMLNYEVRSSSGSVVATAKNDWSNNTGFGLNWNTTGYGVGSYYLYVKVTSSDGQTISCTSPSISLTSSNNQDALALRYVQTAINEIGVRESNGWTKYGDAFGNPYGDWCGYFVMWCAQQIGVYGDNILNTAYIPNAPSTYGSRFAYSSNGYVPLQGDLIVFDLDKNGNCDHVGIVDYTENGKVFYINGNTGSPTINVAYANRSLSDTTIAGFVKFRK